MANNPSVPGHTNTSSIVKLARSSLSTTTGCQQGASRGDSTKERPLPRSGVVPFVNASNKTTGPGAADTLWRPSDRHAAQLVSQQ
jgi:hypothetical protein